MDWTIFLGYLVGVNFVSLVMYGVDKRKAARRKWRIPEARLLLIAAVGGSVGAWAGMYCFRHKTQHLKFKYGIPAILAMQLALAVYVLVRCGAALP